MTEFKTVAKVDSIEPGTGKAFPIEGRMVAVFNDKGEYFAIDDFCPHMGASLAGGPMEDGVVACPWHFWRFQIADGAWCDNPKIKVDSFEVQVIGDEIQVKVPPKPGAGATSADSEQSEETPDSCNSDGPCGPGNACGDADSAND